MARRYHAGRQDESIPIKRGAAVALPRCNHFYAEGNSDCAGLKSVCDSANSLRPKAMLQSVALPAGATKQGKRIVRHPPEAPRLSGLFTF